MRLGDQPAQVRVSLGRLGEERHGGTVEQRELGAGDRRETELLRRVRERQRAVETFVVGEGERRKTEPLRRERELLGERGAVQEGEGGVAMELGVHRRSGGQEDERSVHYGF